MLLDLLQQSRTIRQLAGINDLRAIRASDRYHTALSAGIDLHDMFPSNAFTFSEPKDLLYGFAGNDYRSWKAAKKCKCYKYAKRRSQQVEGLSVTKHYENSGRMGQKNHDEYPRRIGNLPREEFNPTVAELSRTSSVVTTQ